MKPKVSVIIPNYNHAKYLDERISTVLNQTYEDFEVIILDDCSTDNSLKVIEKYRHHPKVKTIVANEVNSGSTFIQWQKGFALASGEYIWLAESDDYADATFLSRIMETMSKDPEIVLGFSSITWVDENSDIIGNSPLVTYTSRPVMKGDYFVRHNMLYGCHILNASSAVFKKNAALNIPDTYMSFRGAGDYLFWIEVARQGKVLKVNQYLDFFRIHRAKVTSNAVASGKQFHEVKRIYHRLMELGYIKGLYRMTVPGFWLQRIANEKKNFLSPEIEKGVYDLWAKEAGCPNFANFLYKCDGLTRVIYKKIFCKNA